MRLMVWTKTLGIVIILSSVTEIGCSDDKQSNNDAGGPAGIGGIVTSGGTGGIGTGGVGTGGVSGGGSGTEMDVSPSSDGAIPVVDTGIGGAGTDGSAGTITPGTGGGDAGGTSGADGSVVIPVDAGDSGPAGDSSMPDSSMPGTVPIDPPVADDCITDVTPGDHTFTCDGITYLVMVDEKCTQFACGLIFDVHGAMMSGEIMRTNGQLHLLAPSKGYLTVHPTAAGSTWNWATDPPKLVTFMDRMIAAFHVDLKRIHMTGFSMGSGMTFWFLCNHTEALASTAPVTGSSADQVTVVGTNENCIQSIDADWQPRVPIFFMCGTQDTALPPTAAQARVDGIVSRLGLTGGEIIDSGDGYTRRRWEGADGMVLDFLAHDYVGGVSGHCIPAMPQADIIFGCAGSNFNWGDVVLQWFIDHPKK
jgi:hypothetical protein